MYRGCPMSDERYAPQMRLPTLGASGQERLTAACVAVVGVGATGSGIADALARAGVGALRLIDRDVVELSNLHRQVLYDEAAVASGLPKAEAARQRLAQINSQVRVEAHVADLQPGNALGLLGGVDLVMDGTDNFAARFLINDACAALMIPWIYTGVVGTVVHGFPVVPGVTACFRCYLDAVPPAGTTQTCDVAGVLGAAVSVGAGFAACEGIKLLVKPEDVAEGLFAYDVWRREGRRLGLPRHPDCPTCAGTYDHLEGEANSSPARLCGRDAVALPAPAAGELDLGALAARLEDLGALEVNNRFLIRFAPRGADMTLTVFTDGRAIVKGTQDLAAARTLYARYVGG